jgi:hypothetical protein
VHFLKFKAICKLFPQLFNFTDFLHISFVYHSTMVHFEAISNSVGGFHSFGGYIAAIFDCVYRNFYKNEILYYFGHATIVTELTRYNKKMMKTAQNFIGIQVYVTDGGIKLIELYYIIDDKFLSFSGTDIATNFGRGLPLIANKTIQSNFNGDLV